MAEEEYLAGSIVESLLTALAYAGDNIAPIVAALDADMFEGVYYDVFTRIMEYRRKYKQPPAPAHLDDIFTHVLNNPDHKQYRAYNRILVGMRELAPTLNLEYLTTRVVTFARRQRLKEGILKANERYLQGGEGLEVELERILYQTLQNRVSTLTYGERLSEDPLSFLRRGMFDDEARVRTGIDEFDRLGLTPTRKELYYLFGRRKAGKSWWLQYLAKKATVQRWIVGHASLENRLPTVKMRYVQTWLAVGKRKDQFIRAHLDVREDSKTGYKELYDIDYEVMEPTLSFDKENDHEKIRRELKHHKNTTNRLIIQEFNSGTLSLEGLEAWLDTLEEQGIYLDMLIVDYPQLMKLDPRDLRGSFSRMTVGIRGLAGERNLAACIVGQTNRPGEDAGILRAKHIGEDISQAATADVFITHNQTEQEARHGLARLHVAGARNDRDKFTVLISQALSTGQFALGSAPMSPDYKDILTDLDKETSKEKVGRPRQEYEDD